jgi:hypothetical protein
MDQTSEHGISRLPALRLALHMLRRARGWAALFLFGFAFPVHAQVACSATNQFQYSFAAQPAAALRRARRRARTWLQMSESKHIASAPLQREYYS